MSIRTVLVTGASGFLGQAILDRLGGSYDLVATGRRRATELSCRYVSADLMQSNLGATLPNTVDAVLHVAGHARASDAILRQNFEMTRRIVDWAIDSHIPNMIIVSTAAVYADSESPKQETSLCQPRTVYGQAKLEAEQYAAAAASSSKLRLVILRKPALIGPTTIGNVSRLIKSLQRRRFVYPGNGQNFKSLISVTDAAAACGLAIDHLSSNPPEAASRIFNVSGGEMSMQEIIDVCCSELGRNKPTRVPAVIALTPLKLLSAASFGYGPAATILKSIEQFMRTDVLDGSLFNMAMGFAPTHNIDHALRAMVQHHIEPC